MQAFEDMLLAFVAHEWVWRILVGLGIAVARAFRTVDPGVVNPATEHWDRVTDLFRQVY